MREVKRQSGKILCIRGEIMLQPEMMIYILLIPLIIYFLLPALVLMAEKMTARGILQTAADGTITGRLNARPGELRECPRRRFEGVIAHVSDGEHCSRVAVKNISRRGICFTCPPDRLNRDADKLAVLLTGSGTNFQLQVRPQWKKQEGAEQSIGAMVLDSLGSWSEFARSADHSRVMRAA